MGLGASLDMIRAFTTGYFVPCRFNTTHFLENTGARGDLASVGLHHYCGLYGIGFECRAESPGNDHWLNDA
jgi:hypothetical protein